MNKVLLSICLLLVTQTSFAGHHEKSESAKKTIIGYPNPNNYKIELGAINNIKDINIISSDIPHSEYNIIHILSI